MLPLGSKDKACSFQSDYRAEVGRQDRGTIEEKGDNRMVKYIKDDIRKIAVQSR